MRQAANESYVLVTGGCGFVGTNLAHRLLSAGQRVCVFDNLARAGVRRNLEWLQEKHGDRLIVKIADTRDITTVRDAVRRASQVFHFAAQVAVTTSLDDPIEDFDINARGTLNVLEAIRTSVHRPPLFFTSTNKVYGGLEDVGMREDEDRYTPRQEHIAQNGISEARPLDFHSPYGCSKGTADQYVRDYARSYGLRTVVFRMSCIYGPHQCGTEDQGWVAHFLMRARDHQTLTIYGDGCQVRDVLYVEDLVDALLLAMRRIERLAGQAFNIGGGPANSVSLLELLSLMAERLRLEARVEHAGWRSGDQRYYVTNSRKFAAATGWSPAISVTEGLSRLDEWTRSESGEAVPLAAPGGSAPGPGVLSGRSPPEPSRPPEPARAPGRISGSA